MSRFNNLVLYDQHQALNSTETITPEPATSWFWNDEASRLVFQLR